MGFTPLRPETSTRRGQLLCWLAVVLSSALLAWAAVLLRREVSSWPG
jgi:hypothetical protein